MLSAVETKTSPILETFAGYPQWLQVACLTVLAVLAIWILSKLLKWALWLLLVAVAVVGGVAAVWLLVH